MSYIVDHSTLQEDQPRAFTRYIRTEEYEIRFDDRNYHCLLFVRQDRQEKLAERTAKRYWVQEILQSHPDAAQGPRARQAQEEIIRLTERIEALEVIHRVLYYAELTFIELHTEVLRLSGQHSDIPSDLPELRTLEYIKSSYRHWLVKRHLEAGRRRRQHDVRARYVTFDEPHPILSEDYFVEPLDDDDLGPIESDALILIPPEELNQTVDETYSESDYEVDDSHHQETKEERDDDSSDSDSTENYDDYSYRYSEDA